jgi:hypothetical protein
VSTPAPGGAFSSVKRPLKGSKSSARIAFGGGGYGPATRVRAMFGEPTGAVFEVDAIIYVRPRVRAHRCRRPS